MFYKPQFESLIKKTLEIYPILNNQSAVNLLLGTCAVESNFGKYLRQLNGGPALGIFQIEETTFNDLVDRFAEKFTDLKSIKFAELEWNLKASILVCRIKYYSIPKGLPNENDVTELARYWKKYYNTEKGSGKIEDFISKYHEFVL